MMRRGVMMVGGISALMMVLWAPVAWSCPEPTAQFQLDGAVVPSTVAGAMYRNCESEVPEQDPAFSLREQESSDPVEIEAEQDRHGLYEVSFVEELAEETVYEFEADPECPTVDGSEARIWTFETGEEAELPTEIGLWTSSGQIEGVVRYPGRLPEQDCTVEAEAILVELDFEPTADAELWGEAIAFETYVNQEIWEPQFGVGETVPAGTGRWGWGREQVYAVCEGEGPQPQPHAEVLERWVNIEIAAWLPGTEQIWLSDNWPLILECEEEEEEEEENQQQNQHQSDGGEQNDEQPDNNGEDEESEEEEPEIVEDDGGCHQSGGGSPGWMLLFAFGSVLVLRRLW